MKTIFCLFREFEDARQAVQQLLAQRFNQNYLNSLVLAQVAKNSIEVKPNQIHRNQNIPITGDQPSQLDLMLSRKQPVALTGVGKMYASGELASMVVKTAAAHPNSSSENGLQQALVDFGLTDEIAKKYVSGLREGGLILFLRTEDEQAPEVAQLLKTMEGSKTIAQAAG